MVLFSSSTTLSAVTSLTSEQVTGAGQHVMATPVAPVRYATGDSNPATESWLSLASLGEGGLEESSKQPSDSRDHTLVADGCTTAAQKSKDSLDGTNHVNGDGSQQGQTTEGDGAGIASSGGGEPESQSGDGSGDGSRGDTGGGGGGGGGGRGGGYGGGDDSLSSSTDSHFESSSEESVKTDTHTPQSEHTEQQIVPIKSKPVSSHPHAREGEARQETPERVTTTITTDLSSAGDLPPCPTGQRGVLPELPVSAVTVVTSNKGRKGAKGRQTMAG